MYCVQAPLTSVECERAGSRLNRILRQQRLRLGSGMVEDYMLVN